MKMKRTLAVICAVTMTVSAFGATAFAVDYGTSNTPAASEDSETVVSNGDIIKAVSNGKPIEITDSSTTVKKHLVAEIAKADKPVVFEAKSFDISIDPATIKEIKDLKLGMDIQTNTEVNAVTIVPEMKGEFGLEMKVTIPAKTLGKIDVSKAHVFYVADDGTVKDLGAVTVNKDGSITIAITHASHYVITTNVEDVAAAASVEADGVVCEL